MQDHLKLENQLCFKYYVISKEIIRQYKPYLEPLDLTYTAYITLLALFEEDAQTVKTLGARLTLDSGTLTPLLKKLEKKDLITRKRDLKDERKVIIALTPQGLAFEAKVAHIPYAITRDILSTHDFTQEEAAASMEALEKVYRLFTTAKK